MIFSNNNSLIIFDFNKGQNISGWNIVDDNVMGGRSSGQMFLSKDGHGIFKGIVSLENNGGFSSVRYRFKGIKTDDFKKLLIRMKGDGKTYQLRIKSNFYDYHSYAINFKTSKKWFTYEFPLKDLYPVFRGRILDIPNFNSQKIVELGFLIGNKKPEKFELLIDNISIK
tara:strand:+ start:264 stop:770 length:507 start_codon:yes stop_codon:yes gene_type:complete